MGEGRTAAIKRASNLRNLRIAEVSELDVQIEDGTVKAYRVKLKVSFKYEGPLTDPAQTQRTLRGRPRRCTRAPRCLRRPNRQRHVPFIRRDVNVIKMCGRHRGLTVQAAALECPPAFHDDPPIRVRCH